VDSTRRGKCRLSLTSPNSLLIVAAMPDALSKTVPIWCTVMNMTLFTNKTEYHGLHVPPQVISQSEKAQIEDRLPSFVRQLGELQVDLSAIKRKILKPLRPVWVTRDSLLPEDIPQFDAFYPIVLCTSSRRVIGSEMSEGGYIQGAGDDSESWSYGLDPPTFWKYRDMILRTPEDDIPDLIGDLMGGEKHAEGLSKSDNIASAPQLHIDNVKNLDRISFLGNDVLITCGQLTNGRLSKKRHLHLKCREKKLGSRDLRAELLKLVPFLSTLDRAENIYVACPDGKDLSVGVGLAILCLFFNGEGDFIPHKTDVYTLEITKPFIRQRLAWILTSIPQANPSRATLQSVNDFLFSTRSTINTTA
jgi:tRNA A64-2'-O-ribosylphosphate transferase